MTKRGRKPENPVSTDDALLIAACKAEREKMKRDIKQLTDIKLAEKFGYTLKKIQSVPIYLAEGE